MTDQVIHKTTGKVAIFQGRLFGKKVVGKAYPDLSELAYHIVSLCDFWKRSKSYLEERNLLQVVSKMIGISLGVDNADKIAHAVIMELKSIRADGEGRQVDLESIEVVFISSFLREQAGELTVPATTAYWTSVFQPAT